MRSKEKYYMGMPAKGNEDLDAANQVLLRPARFARLADISRSLVYRMIAEKKLPSVRCAGCVLIPASALDDLVIRAINDMSA